MSTLAAGHRRELLAHCYRMLGSPEDAEEALQETLLAAWRGLPGFEQRSSLRVWLYGIATNCCLRLAGRRPQRGLSWDHGPPHAPADDLGEFVPGRIWIEPWFGDVAGRETDGADPADSGPSAALVVGLTPAGRHSIGRSRTLWSLDRTADRWRRGTSHGAGTRRTADRRRAEVSSAASARAGRRLTLVGWHGPVTSSRVGHWRGTSARPTDRRCRSAGSRPS